MSLHTKEPQYQRWPVPSSSRRSLAGVFVEKTARSCRPDLRVVGNSLARRASSLSIVRPPVLVGRAPLRLRDARSSKLKWMTYWRKFSSRSFGTESPKNFLLLRSSRSSHVGSHLLGTRTLLFAVFRSGIAPVLREAKRGDPYRRNTPKEGRFSHVVANDG
jgi:hypothetical protein